MYVITACCCLLKFPLSLSLLPSWALSLSLRSPFTRYVQYPWTIKGIPECSVSSWIHKRLDFIVCKLQHVVPMYYNSSTQHFCLCTNAKYSRCVFCSLRLRSVWCACVHINDAGKHTHMHTMCALCPCADTNSLRCRGRRQTHTLTRSTVYPMQ